MEPVSYALTLKSIYGIVPSTGVINTAAVNDSALNQDLLYIANVYNLFSRIASIHKVNNAKIELAGIIFLCDAASNNNRGIDIVLSMPELMQTTYNNNNSTTSTDLHTADKIIACVNNNVNGTNYVSSSTIAYKTPLYLTNISSIQNLRIKLFDGLGGTNNGANTPAYSVTFRITPMFS